MDTIIYGDSLAGSYGLSEGMTWPELLKQSTELKISRVIFKNGYTTTDLLECLEREVLFHAPERVIFICGTNDAVAMRRAEDIIETVNVIAGTIREKGANPLWLIPPQVDEDQAAGTWQDPLSVYRRTSEILSNVRRISPDRITFKAIDLEKVRLSYLAFGRKPLTDGVHFDRGFHEYLAEELREILLD